MEVLKQNKHFFVFILLIIRSIYSFCQTSDHFTDGDFIANPIWQGEATAFTINNFQLQLNSTGTDTSYLCTNNNMSLNNSEWQCWVKLNFTPSDNNFAKIYLVSDQTNLEGALNGYFVRLGENGSFDSVDLWKQTGTTETKIIDGINGHCAKSSNTLRIKVTRNNLGLWSLYADTLGGNNFLLEGSATDITHTSTNYFGVFCKYTTSNSTKFYFDDAYAGPIVIDTLKPIVDSIKVLSANQLDVYFSESVSATSAEVELNYTIDNGIGNPIAAIQDIGNSSVVHLTLSNNLTNANTYNITISAISDITGNVMISSILPFTYYLPQRYDVVINEVMADPDPPIGLPNAEYIELYNTTTYSILLDNWSIAIGNTVKTLPPFTLQGNGYVVLTSSTYGNLFGTNIPVLGIASFPSLTNTGQSIVLRNASGALVSNIHYTDDWYQSATKKNGGWSLEQIDPTNPCAGESNWKASIQNTGGTPGFVNSINTTNTDQGAPQLMRVSYLGRDSILLHFTEPLDSMQAATVNNYSIDYGVGSPITAVALAPDFSKIKLVLSTPLQNGIVYAISVTGNISDCKGNTISSNSQVQFGIPDSILTGSILINEILFDPKENGVDFVELYNNSNTILDLKNILIGSQDTIAQTLTELKTISSQSYLLLPKEYVVLSTNSKTVKAQYATTNPFHFIDMSSLPSMSNEGDVVVISNIQETIIDRLVYTPDMHFPLLNETKGVSLERLSFSRPTADKNNWHSAAESVGYATPAYENSQFVSSENTLVLSVEPAVFSPNNDGYNDVVNIHYQFEEPGWVANLTVFDSRGQPIRQLIKNDLLGIKGSFSWDGITDDREKAGMGIYIFYLECFSTKGEVKKYKKTGVLSNK